MFKKEYFSDRIPALVIGGDISALNVIRSLGRRGIKVYVMGSDAKEYGASSRYAKFIYCRKLTDEESVVSKMVEISKHFKNKMVAFCTSDLHVLFVSKNREILEKYYDFVLPEHRVIEILMNKKNFYDFATLHGYSVPETFFSNNRTDLETIVRSTSYPCVVKPLFRTRYWSDHVPPQKKVFKVDSAKHLEQELEKLGISDQPLILQKWIPGDDQQVYFCLAYINKKGKPLALLTGKKLRQYPLLTGVTSLAETIKDQKLSDLTVEILSKAECKGLCSVEFKWDNGDKSFKITEPTVGRVDLQEGISTQSGLDIPYFAYQDALEISQSEQMNYKVGIKWINEPFEFNFFLSRVKEHKNRKGNFFNAYRGPCSFALLSKDDPVPFLRFVFWTVKRGFRYLKKFNPLFN